MNKHIYISRILDCPVFDPMGDRLGKVKDVLVTYRLNKSPRVVGMIVEIPGRRQVFMSIYRVTSFNSGYVSTRGVINVQRFKQRANEVCLMREIRGKKVKMSSGNNAIVEDIELISTSSGDWHVGQLFVRFPGNGLFSRGNTEFAAWQDVTGLDDDEATNRIFRTYSDLKPADLAAAFRDLSSRDVLKIVEELPDERLADVLEEMPEKEQVKIVDTLDDTRAANILEEMQPDDAVDLIGHLSTERGENLLQLMEPEDARSLRLLLDFEPHTAGGLMTSDLVIVSPDSTIAECLSLIRRHELAPALASTVCVVLPPYEPPTGRFIGIAHFQALLRQPPHQRISTIIDRSMEPADPSMPASKVSRILASYNLLSLPVVDERKRLLGIITVDDVLDYMLPKNWRQDDTDEDSR